MNKLKGNLLYGQSGGPTSIINTSAYGLFIEAFNNKNIINKIYDLNYGIQGLLEEKIIEIKNDSNLKKLLNTPGSFFGSNRFKLGDIKEEILVYKRILEVFKNFNIRYFFYNGGNDSMDTINKIGIFFKNNNYECRLIGINKTIDNDLVNTDFSLGYVSAAKFIINSTIEIALDDLSYQKGRVNIIETMGRNTGWLAASSSLASVKGLKPDLIYVPEIPFDIETFLKKVKEIYQKKKHCLVVVSEGIKDNEGNFIYQSTPLLDRFDHNQLGGVAIKLASYINEKLNYKTRYFELSLLQRASSITTSSLEQKIAIELSRFALASAIAGESNKIVVINRIKSNPYEYNFSLVPLKDVANKERKLELKYIDSINSSINDEFIDYLLPLIDGNDGILDILEKTK